MNEISSKKPNRQKLELSNSFKHSVLYNEYLVLDYYDSVNKQNTREIYKRVVE